MEYTMIKTFIAALCLSVLTACSVEPAFAQYDPCQTIEEITDIVVNMVPDATVAYINTDRVVYQSPSHLSYLYVKFDGNGCFVEQAIIDQDAFDLMFGKPI